MNDKGPSVEAENPDNVQRGYLGTTPPPGKAPEKGERQWIERPDQLLNAVAVLKQADVVAIDAEFTQIRSRTQTDTSTSSHRLALLQLAIDGHCFIVDALRLNDLSPLDEVTDNPEIIVLLHGAGADLRVMAERGLSVAHYYDLEAASRSIFGQHESSLAAMLQRAFHIHLDKTLQRTDWTRRPLPPAMVAYAARDAEMTLALYYWLREHYQWALDLHENTKEIEPVASWIAPFLRNNSPVSAEVAITEARQQGQILKNEQIVEDCRAALAIITHPQHRSRLLRLIADLSLRSMAPDIEPLLSAPTSDERSASARALGRMNIKAAKDAIRPLLHDPVQDVRKAAQSALRSLGDKNLKEYTAPAIRLSDGSRSWTVEGDTQTDENEGDDNGWKARLRSMMDK